MLQGPPVLDHRLLIIGVATGLATLGGGVLAIRLRSRLSALAAFGAGAVIGIALMDLLPEALELGRNMYAPHLLPLLTLAGFMIYLAVGHLKGSATGAFSRALGPASLVLHSVMDGFGIGVAFTASTAIGLTVAAAVITHDLLDGSNTVTLSVSGHPNILRAWIWLLLDAVAPLAGIALSQVMAPPPALLPLVLALFAGLFLFIGAGDLLPRSRVNRPGALNPILTVMGAAFAASLVWFAAQ